MYVILPVVNIMLLSSRDEEWTTEVCWVSSHLPEFLTTEIFQISHL